MDPITMIYYAAVCAALGVSLGPVRSRVWRLAVGALVGVVAAGALPAVRMTLGL